ncbi:beta-lactam sensor/signal transducer [Spirosoma daeguense]
MNAFKFLPNSVVDALGWTLLHAIWQGFALVLPIAVMLHLLRNKSSNLRYQISVFTLLAQVLASGATFLWYYKPDVATQPLLSGSLSQQAMLIRWQTASQTLSWTHQFQQFLQMHLTEFVLVYLIGVTLFGLRLAGGWLYLQRLTNTATPTVSVACKQLVSQLRSSMAIRSAIRVMDSAHITVPMVVGVLKPVVLIPIGLLSHLTPREVEAVLAHELAHIKRHDYAVNLLQSVVEVLYFFHPALWWLSARVREEREHCCDDLAVQICGGNGHILAQALARVEELRLMQVANTPVLGMALASKKQHLLHRVRRMLGAPSRPFISNSSLAGITFATLLLMSVSVYAVQKQDKPVRNKTTQPKPASRKHKIDRNSEYGMVDGHTISYVVWKSRKLTTARVARLQRELDQVNAGKLSLDAIPASDRDILLTIIEKNAAFDGGMTALADGLSHIDYDNIVASVTNNVSVNVDKTLEQLAKVDLDVTVNNSMRTLSHLLPANDSLDRLRALQRRNMDSVSQLMAERSKQVEALHSQMEKLRFPIEESERSQQVLEWRKQKLEQQRQALIEKHYQLLNNDSKQKLSQTEIEKQLAALEPDIKAQETSIEELNKQLETARLKMQDVRLPMEKLEKEAMQLQEQMDRMNEKLDRQRLYHMYSDQAFELAADQLREEVKPSRTRWMRSTPRPPRSPRPASVSPRARVGVISPLDPAQPVLPAPPLEAIAPLDAAIAPIAPDVEAAAPARATKPRVKSKSAKAPKPE